RHAATTSSSAGSRDRWTRRRARGNASRPRVTTWSRSAIASTRIPSSASRRNERPPGSPRRSTRRASGCRAASASCRRRSSPRPGRGRSALRSAPSTTVCRASGTRAATTSSQPWRPARGSRRGGDMPNVVPAHTEAHYIVRARTLADLGEARAKVHRCFEAGALATGARLEIADDHEPYAEMEHDREIAALYRRNAEALGRAFPDLGMFLERAAGSTDMGNVSLAIPSIHPYIGIDSLPAVNHQPEFAAHCATAAADRALADGALAMAWTAVDLATDAALRRKLVARLGAR